ncbi:UDP-2,4-diacetamido-2,4,6-trideoxy-beta-L-altropyranose hydrolase [Methanocalculus alkaliphilus]|uniref:UDP-2,4-diacetamido-2,4, 6-trideoxy-beta-L-altropyranose hydrolase n=1 Tax=Methanocalculus alkaliphilus TaxID=768730 RepID=UPI00209E8AEF|nr:UDP-2,4-diacetamido-2,4,6-trideoxy-beta-L-altropyranose hydrolase [Methanocalculus alkaliphilus]MCP1716326.1 UDP-2,4-diacetamido-2,4,6-trideoxy-beta-L-altropyranose hydrolase [Methanocalculus alkaliphilus]
MPKSIFFRTDASHTIGTGHVTRCLTLAKALQDSGAQVIFICREHEGDLCNHIEEQGFAVHRLPSPRKGFVPDDVSAHAAWLGASWQEDADATVAAITSLQIKPEWLIIDHYGIDRRWEERLLPLISKIMVIDDIADRHHDCDLLLDQNLVPDMENRYDGLLPEGCTRLLGSDYALLQPIYAELHDRIPPRKGSIRRILISFGGADSDNLTGRALEAFIGLNRSDIEVDVVIANNSPYFASLKTLTHRHPNVHLHGTIPTLAPLMAKADLAIGAAGATSWERLCLGLPAVVVTLADNQVPIAEGLQERGLLQWIGDKDSITKELIQDCLGDLVEHGIDDSWSQRCHLAVDGRGIDRVLAVLILTPESPLHVRHATLADEALLLVWANDPETRKNSFSKDPISSATHRQWFHSRLRDIDGCSIYILETESGVPIGQVRFEREELGWELHYTVAPEFRGRGIGKSLLNAAIQKFRDEKSGVLVFGRAKPENIRSQRIFEGLGFTSKPGGGGVEYQRLL